MNAKRAGTIGIVIGILTAASLSMAHAAGNKNDTADITQNQPKVSGSIIKSPPRAVEPNVAPLPKGASIPIRPSIEVDSKIVQPPQQSVVTPEYTGRSKADKLREASEAAAHAKQIQQMEQLRNMQEQMWERSRGAGNSSDSAYGTALGGHGPSVEKRGFPTRQGMGRSDCISNPADCIGRSDRQSGNLSDPTRSAKEAAGVPSDGGISSDGFTSRSVTRNPRTGAVAGFRFTYTNSDGSTTEGEYHNNNGTEMYTETTTTSDGTLKGREHSVEIHGPGGSTPGESNSRSGHVNREYEETEWFQARNEEVNPSNQKKPQPDGGTKTGQPIEGGNVGKADDCNYSVVQRRCLKYKRPTKEEMTGQPSPTGEGTVTGGYSGPNVGTDAVTNTGGGDWSVDTSRTGGKSNKPIGYGVVDPVEGGPVDPTPE